MVRIAKGSQCVEARSAQNVPRVHCGISGIDGSLRHQGEPSWRRIGLSVRGPIRERWRCRNPHIREEGCCEDEDPWPGGRIWQDRIDRCWSAGRAARIGRPEARAPRLGARDRHSAAIWRVCCCSLLEWHRIRIDRVAETASSTSGRASRESGPNPERSTFTRLDYRPTRRSGLWHGVQADPLR